MLNNPPSPLVDRRTIYALTAVCLASIIGLLVWGPGRAEQLPALNASLNAAAGILLVLGYVLIKANWQRAHSAVMLTAFVTSMVFLTSYLIYHFQVTHKPFNGPSQIRPYYYAMLISHVLLAAAVPILAIRTMQLAFKERWAEHRKAAWWTLPIWLYVSITGVLIYWLLYVAYPNAA